MYIILLLMTITAAIFVVEMFVYASRILRNPDRRKVRKRLKSIAATTYEHTDHSILRKRRLSEVSFLDRILFGAPFVHRLDRLLQQANSGQTFGAFLLTTIFLALMSFMLGWVTTRSYFLAVGLTIVVGGLPLFLLIVKKRRRMQKFERQLPDALELIARALRAGHAFSSGMQLAADEFEDPLGSEFGHTIDEINFGVGVPDALSNLSLRVDCPDLRFFVVCVVIQREAGGNLSEIIDNIASIIRERFKLRGRIQVLAAEGKFSALVLVALPFLVILALRFVNPNYITGLIADPAGRAMAIGAAIMMGLGIMVIKRMITIRI
jgi:tight adherence protein B